jgi:hypothetical protein
MIGIPFLLLRFPGPPISDKLLYLGYGIFAQVLCISSAEKALIVSVRMCPVIQ